MTPSYVAAFAAAHPLAFSLLLVPLVTVIGNALLWLFTSAKWTAFLAARPRLAACFKLLSAAGVDPVKIVKWAIVLVTGKPPVDPVAPSTAPKTGGAS